MGISANEKDAPIATDMSVTDAALTVELSDGRTLSVPLAWYPRLEYATPAERGHWHFIANGQGIHWPEIDEHIRVVALLDGKGSNESQASLQRWLDSRGS